MTQTANDPQAIVQAYLDAMEARDLAHAQSFLGSGFQMVFPGTAPMTTLEELIAWAAPRYRFVKKTYDGYDHAAREDADIVYCFGTLAGEWPDGTAFRGIRFVDRFELREGRIVRQDVWNDLAETKANA